MTRKELITKCVENQIERGIIKEQSKQMQINSRLKGKYQMCLLDCQRWYNEIFKQ